MVTELSVHCFNLLGLCFILGLWKLHVPEQWLREGLASLEAWLHLQLAVYEINTSTQLKRLLFCWFVTKGVQGGAVGFLWHLHRGQSLSGCFTKPACFLVPVFSESKSSRISFSGQFSNTFIWWQISCEKGLLMKFFDLHIFFQCCLESKMVWWDNSKDLSFNGMTYITENHTKPM